MDNPYQAPVSRLEVRVKHNRNDRRLDDVAYGQKRIIYAILLYFAAGVMAQLNGVLALLALFALLAVLAMSWSGIYQISRGLGYPIWLRLLLILLMFVPLVGLLILIFLSTRASTRLKEAGYEIGLMGARNY
jgi:lysylphosphatidylglycerol synthetase-like protein (DUF2156 family)